MQPSDHVWEIVSVEGCCVMQRVQLVVRQQSEEVLPPLDVGGVGSFACPKGSKARFGQCERGFLDPLLGEPSNSLGGRRNAHGQEAAPATDRGQHSVQSVTHEKKKCPGRWFFEGFEERVGGACVEILCRTQQDDLSTSTVSSQPHESRDRPDLRNGDLLATSFLPDVAVVSTTTGSVRFFAQK
jgi:hypothetical protein